jgi:hypothetical protein
MDLMTGLFLTVSYIFSYINACNVLAVCKQHTVPCSMDSRDSVVGMATRYELEGSGLELRCGLKFPHPSVPSTRLTQAPVQAVQVCFQGVKWPDRGIKNHPYLAPRYKKVIAVPLLSCLCRHGRLQDEL